MNRRGTPLSCCEEGLTVEVVTGYVEHIVFRNEENGYTVFRLENDDGESNLCREF